MTPNRHKKRIILGEGYPWPHGVGSNTTIGLNQTADGASINLDIPKSLWREDVPVYRLVLERNDIVAPDKMIAQLGDRLYDAISGLQSNDSRERSTCAKRIMEFLKHNDLLDEKRVKRIVSLGVSA